MERAVGEESGAPGGEEQKAICQTCLPPTDGSRKGQMVRVTAAAGAGKTTVLLQLGLKAVQQGHRHITYVTFSKSAAKDGETRLRQTLKQQNITIDAMTLHSCAQRALKEHYHDNESDEARAFNSREIQSDKKIQEWIGMECKDAMDEFLKECYSEIEHTTEAKTAEEMHVKIERRKKRARQKVLEFIEKTLQKNFCCRKHSLREFNDPENKYRTYFPCQRFHVVKKKRVKVEPASGNGKTTTELIPVASEQAVRLGFTNPKYLKDTTTSWYADQASRLWTKIVEDGMRSFSIEMKLAQLLKLRVRGTILLVDEAQDMDECQVDWIANQQIGFGTHVYVVGDAAQSIYTFRGAKSQYLMGLKANVDRSLTASWRFGNEITAIANTVLYAKAKSPQSKPQYVYSENKWIFKYWIPYRVTAGNPFNAGRVTTDSLISQWRSIGQVTLLARSNATLFEQVVNNFLTDLIPVEVTQSSESAGEDSDEESDEESTGNAPSNQDGEFIVEEPIESEDEEPSSGSQGTQNYPPSLPKFHINGGATSGRRTFQRAFRQVESLFELYSMDESRMELPKSIFPEFEDEKVSWSSFIKECQDFEYTKYMTAVGIICIFKDKTMEAVEKFKKFVLDQTFSADKADIILSTAHSSKGMEWERVQLCNDFEVLCRFNKDGKVYRRKPLAGAGLGNERWEKVEDKAWQFAMSEYGDGVNVLYVAATRAKRLLSIPCAIVNLMQNFDAVHRWVLDNSTTTNAPIFRTPPQVKGVCSGLQLENIESFYNELVLPYRKEQNLTYRQFAVDVLIRNEDQQEGTVELNPAQVFITPSQSQIGREKNGTSSPQSSCAARRRLFNSITPPKRKKGKKVTPARNEDSSKQTSLHQFLGKPQAKKYAPAKRKLDFGDPIKLKAKKPRASASVVSSHSASLRGFVTLKSPPKEETSPTENGDKSNNDDEEKVGKQFAKPDNSG